MKVVGCYDSEIWDQTNYSQTFEEQTCSHFVKFFFLLRLFTENFILKGPGPERPISANPELKFCSVVPLLRVPFCSIITVYQSKGSTIFCELELHVLRQENRV